MSYANRTMGVLAFGLALAVIGGVATAGDEKAITVDGSTTVGPIAKAFAGYYQRVNPGVKITVSESGSGNGAKALINGTCDVADMSRFMKATEFKAAVEKGVMPVAHVVAMDGIAVVAHPSNPVRGLTVAQIKDIYTGAVTNWNQVGGPNREIVVITRDTSSGTYETFEEKVLGGAKIMDKAENANSNGQVRARVQATPAAIGYVGLGFVGDNVKALLVNEVEATEKTVAGGVYPIARPLYMFTNGYPKLGSHLHRFVTLYLTKEGQEMVRESGYVPVTAY